MMFARFLCAMGFIMGLLMIICPLYIFKVQNIFRSIFMSNKLEVDNFKSFIYRVGGIFYVLIFTLLFTQTFKI